MDYNEKEQQQIADVIDHLQIAQKVDELTDAISELTAELEPLQQALKQMQLELKTIVLDHNLNVNQNGVTAKISNGYERASWNSKGLEGYAVANPDVLKFRKVSTVKPSVTVKVAKPSD